MSALSTALRGLLTSREDAPQRDYRPAHAGEAREMEELFGDMLATGHSIRESADFLVRYGHEGID